jgi:tagatose 1,6-diphosphate aldolase
MNQVASQFGALTDRGRFTVLAIDHSSLGSGLDSAQAADTSAHEARAVKLDVVETLAPGCSAVLADVPLAESGPFQRMLARHRFGLIVSLDEAGYDWRAQLPPSLPSREKVEHLRTLGAAAAKVVVYYHPAAPDAAQRRSIVSAIAVETERVGLPLLVEPLPRTGDALSTWPADTVASEVAACGASIVKLPLPDIPSKRLGALAGRITASLGSVPWILLSSGDPFPSFMTKLTIAMDGGASGFAAGRSLWDQLVSRPRDPSARREARRRLDEAITATAAKDSPHS